MTLYNKTASNERRYLRLFAFTIFALFSAYLVVNVSLAWIYIQALARPGCTSSPTPIAGVPIPEEHWLPINDRHVLRFWYYPPQNGAVVIAVGGLGGSLGNTLPPVEFLINRGYGVLQFDSRACAKPAALVTLGNNEVLDAAAGLAFLAGQPEVKRIGALGFSMGGVTVIRAAARHPEILAVVAEGGYFNLGAHIVKPESQDSILRKIFLYTVAGVYWLQTGTNPWRISPIDDLPEISPRPVLLIYGEHELSDGRGDLQYAAAHKPKTLWIVPGGNHGTNYTISPQEYQSRVLDFFHQALKEP